jgi:hypothetical protein
MQQKNGKKEPDRKEERKREEMACLHADRGDGQTRYPRSPCPAGSGSFSFLQEKNHERRDKPARNYKKEQMNERRSEGTFDDVFARETALVRARATPEN